MSTPTEAVRHAYFAHRFELAAPGLHRRLWSHDLVAAYPWAMAQVPCWAHGEWVPWLRAPYYLALVSWELPARTRERFGPFPWRYPDGYACYPLHGAGWVWSPEIRVLDDWMPEIKWEFHDVWSFVPGCDCRPWDWTWNYLAKRQEFPLLKKFLNCCPGKLAQSRPVRGPWFDPTSAGYLTSLVRARMLGAASAVGRHAVAITADALWTDKEVDLNALLQRPVQPSARTPQEGDRPLPRHRSAALPVQEVRGAAVGADRGDLADTVGHEAPGDWRVKDYNKVTFVRSEISYASSEITAAAGTPAHALAGLQPWFAAAWRHAGLSAGLAVPYRHVVTVAEAAASGLAPGTVLDLAHEVSFDPGRKRAGWTDNGRRPDVIWTRPPGEPDAHVADLAGAPLSTPYWSEAWEPLGEPAEWPELVDSVG